MTKDDPQLSREAILNALSIESRTVTAFYDLVQNLDTMTLDSYNAWCVMANDLVTRVSLTAEDIKQYLRDRVSDETS